jgi:DNA-binding Lrp family transcriptional regulator
MLSLVRFQYRQNHEESGRFKAAKWINCGVIIYKTTEKFGKMQITQKDRELLALLGENARMPVATLARRLGLSRTTVQTRLERLERDGVIAGYALRLSDAYMSGLIRAHVLITIAPKALSLVTTELSAIGDVTALHSVNGPYDLIAIIASPSIAELDRLIDLIGDLPGVERTLSSIILSNRLVR